MITTNDAWNANLYDARHSYVSKYGEDLIRCLSPQKDEKICDLGCGTGDLSKIIADAGAQVMGIDSSLAMIIQAKNKYPSIDFIHGDATAMTFSNEFDAMFSNATLHWVRDAERSIEGVWKALKNKGRFIAEFGGKNNISAIVEAINKALDHFSFSENKRKNPWTFFSPGEYTILLEKSGFVVREVLYYDRPTALDGKEDGLRNWITMFASFFFEGIPADTYQEILLYIEGEAKSILFAKDTWYADYKRLRIIAEKA